MITTATLRIGSLLGAGIAAAAAILTLTAPPALAHSSLGAEQDFCQAIGGTFAITLNGGDARGQCAFTVHDEAHHLYYHDGLLIGSD